MTPLKKRKELLSVTLVKNLEKRHFEAYYCPTAAEAIEKVLSLMPEGSSVSWGGSMTIRDMGLTKAVKEGNYHVIDRDTAANPAEMREMHRQGLLTDFYLTSTNAISEDGVLVNIDGTGNRVAAISFGPNNVIVLASLSKVAQDVDAAIKRVRSYVAPVNSMRFMGKTPCAVDGTCHNCTSAECICNQVLITRVCRPAGRIKVILIGEELGY
ncbi:MAG: lactate utilization protein [Anaerotignum sp.]|nr:lactate utilization protein [Anaerotignum sp.]